jgi:hypothetical protein
MNELIVVEEIAGCITKRVYHMALNEFLAWFQQAPRPGFTKANSADAARHTPRNCVRLHRSSLTTS